MSSPPPAEVGQFEVPSADDLPPPEPSPRLEVAIKRINEELFGPNAGILVDDPNLLAELMCQRISAMERKLEQTRRMHTENEENRQQRLAVEAMDVEMRSQMAAALEPAQRRGNACGVVLESFQGAADELRETITALNMDSDDTERKIAALKTEWQLQQQRSAALKDGIERRKSLVRGEMRRAVLLERKLDKKRAKEAIILAVADDMKARNAELKEKVEAMRASSEAAVANADEARVQFEESCRRLDQSKSALSKDAERRAAMEKRLADVETRRDEIRKEGVASERKVAILEDEILVLQKENAALNTTTAERLEQINRERDDESHRHARDLLDIEERMNRETRNLNGFQQELHSHNAAMAAEIEVKQQNIDKAKATRENALALHERIAREVFEMEATLEAMEDSKPLIEVPETSENDENLLPTGSQRRNIDLAPETGLGNPSSSNSVEFIDVPEMNDPANELVEMSLRLKAGPDEQRATLLSERKKVLERRASLTTSSESLSPITRAIRRLDQSEEIFNEDEQN